MKNALDLHDKVNELLSFVQAINELEQIAKVNNKRFFCKVIHEDVLDRLYKLRFKVDIERIEILHKLENMHIHDIVENIENTE